MAEETLFTVEIELTMGLTFPSIQFDNNIKDVLTVDIGPFHQVQRHTGTLIDSLTLEYNGKNSSETIIDDSGTIIRDQTVTIKNLWIDNIIVPQTFLITHSKYYPRYHQDFLNYCKEHNIIVNNGPLHEIKFWHSGTWKFDIVQPFWDWFYNEECAAQDQKHNPNYVGYSKDHVKQQLQKIKDILYHGL